MLFLPFIHLPASRPPAAEYSVSLLTPRLSYMNASELVTPAPTILHPLVSLNLICCLLHPPLPFPFTSTLTLTLCHAAGVISAQVQHSHRDAIREQQWQQRQREYDGEGDGGMKKRRGGAERWPERRRERKVQHKDKIHQFVVHIRKESGPFNRATDGPTFRKNKRRTFFFLPFFYVFNKCARL